MAFYKTVDVTAHGDAETKTVVAHGPGDVWFISAKDNVFIHEPVIRCSHCRTMKQDARVKCSACGAPY